MSCCWSTRVSHVFLGRERRCARKSAGRNQELLCSSSEARTSRVPVSFNKDYTMSEKDRQRKRPNILVTGTPGVGKTATASAIAVSVARKTYLIAGR